MIVQGSAKRWVRMEPSRLSIMVQHQRPTKERERKKEKCPIKPVCQCDGDVGTDRQSEEVSKFLRCGDKNDE